MVCSIFVQFYAAIWFAVYRALGQVTIEQRPNESPWRICTTQHFLELVKVMGVEDTLCELYLSWRYNLSATSSHLSEADLCVNFSSRRLIINGGLMTRLIVMGDFNQNTRFSISFEIIWQTCARWDNSTYSTVISVPENHEWVPLYCDRCLAFVIVTDHRVSNNSRLDQTTINRQESFIYWTLP